MKREGELFLEEEGRGEWEQEDSPRGHCFCVSLVSAGAFPLVSGLFKPELPG